MSDRTVHGEGHDERGPFEAVRYDRSGKWYLEWDPRFLVEVDGKRPRTRRLVSVAEAAESVGRAFLGKPGGRRFDTLVRKAWS